MPCAFLWGFFHWLLLPEIRGIGDHADPGFGAGLAFRVGLDASVIAQIRVFDVHIGADIGLACAFVAFIHRFFDLDEGKMSVFVRKSVFFGHFLSSFVVFLPFFSFLS